MAPEPATVPDAIAWALGGASVWCVETVAFTALLRLVRLPKVHAGPLAASLAGFLQAGSLLERFLRASSIGAAAAVAVAIIQNQRLSTDRKEVRILAWTMLLPIGITALSLIAAVVGILAAEGAQLRLNLAAIAAAVSVATVLAASSRLLPQKPLGRLMVVMCTLAVATAVEAVGTAYLPSHSPEAPVTRGPAEAEFAGSPLTVRSREDLLSVTLPPGTSAPTRTDTTVSGPFGDVLVTTYAADGLSDDAYIASVSDLPPAAFERPLSQILDEWRDNCLVGLSGRAVSQEELLLSGYHGRRIHVESLDDAAPLFGRMECIVGEPHLFQIGYVSPKKKAVSAPAVASFFKSVKIAGTSLHGQGGHP